MSKKLMEEMAAKVNYEGGLTEMLYYGTLPNIAEFPELHEAFKTACFAFEELERVYEELLEYYEIEEE